jgi:ATP-dependent Clp protease protease subunit
LKKTKQRMATVTQSVSPGTLDLYIYGDVTEDYYDPRTDQMIISDTSAKYLKDELAKHSDLKQINVYINSLGGSLLEGTGIYGLLKRHSAAKTVYIDGFACSIASVIAMAGDKIIMPKNAMMMVHNCWVVTIGNAAELRKTADNLDVIMQGNRQAYLEKSGGKISESKLTKLMDNETWLTATDCIIYGLADEYSGEVDLAEAKQSLQQLTGSSRHLAARFTNFPKDQPKKRSAETQGKSDKMLRMVAAIKPSDILTAAKNKANN